MAGSVPSRAEPVGSLVTGTDGYVLPLPADRRRTEEER
jgi:hypothetical protein